MRTFSFLHIQTYLLLLFLIFGCEKQGKDTNGAVKPMEPIVLTKAEATMLSASNDFGLNLFREVRTLEEGSSSFISPFSIATVLSLLSAGAEGETREEIVSALGLKEFSPEETGVFYTSLYNALTTADNSVTLESANGLWFDKTLNKSIKSPFIDIVKNRFSVQPDYDDLSSMAFLDKLNNWCKKQTHGKINQILDTPPAYSKMLAANAIYFSGKWSTPFEKEEKKPFYHLNGKQENVMMLEGGKIPIAYSSRNGWEYAAIPYGNSAFQLEILVPKDDIFDTACNHLSSTVLNGLRDRTHSYSPYKISLPKINVSYSNNIIAKNLNRLGICKLFGEDSDLSGISDKKITFDTMIHKTAFSMDKKGSEAAAISVAYSIGSASAIPSTPEFIIDRPFIYLISEKSTGCILFIGQYL